ncbi:UxaA family hydrolase [Emergencia sp.]|uniref:UxaA family hydrolase n=1 Tax=Emergencia sp. TaxID=1926557 RepID=UPI003AEFFCFE
MNGILLDKADTVVTVTEEIAAGVSVSYLFESAETQVTAIEDIPQYHKIAIVNIKAGENILKYGEPIGYATQDIFAGQHVHTQNMDNQ